MLKTKDGWIELVITDVGEVHDRGSARFALQMIEGNELVRFTVSSGD